MAPLTSGTTARRMFGLVEPIGLIPYVVQEPSEALLALGLRNYWDTYFAGGWSLTLGAQGTVGPSYEGASNMGFLAAPMVSLGRSGAGPVFTSRNDNPGLAVFDAGNFQIGPVAKILFERTDSASNDLRGLKDVPWGGELGLFMNYYPSDWLRLRAEVRQGIRSHHGVVADLSADAFYDITPTWRI